MKKVTYISIFLLLAIFLILNINEKNYKSIPQYQKSISENIALMIETDVSSGEYEKSTLTAWPTDHEFNYELSYCLNNSPINWDEENNDLILNTEGTEKCYIYFNKKGPTFAETILANNGGTSAIAAKSTPDFAIIADTNEGMYAMTDDYGTSYYFRGAVNNNWVKFANIYWRIVRVNGNGTVKLIYSGTTAPTSAQATVMTGTGTQINGTTYVFNSNYGSAEYVGYMYTLGEQRGFGTSSPIKTTLESWYTSNLSSYDAKIADTIFCNDRSTYLGTKWLGAYSGNGVGTVDTYFGATGRLIANGSTYGPIGTGPSLVCPHKSDAFTKTDTTKGNGQLAQKVGLLTADEASIAGLIAGSSTSSNYLYTNSHYWLGSPSYFGSGDSAIEFRVGFAGRLSSNYVNNTLGARAVVSLSSDISASSGSGTWSSPYVIN